ncbi:unnamed protein product [Polarella glacialis]|uniref:Aminomethyltransferase folate-binding domain-containing protein n=1 Tax=Polarella glacialis TaxID=89957 RepID=A0A813D1S9_POLGL|nr:unnamed protein product [Polarella glacialis]
MWSCPRVSGAMLGPLRAASLKPGTSGIFGCRGYVNAKVSRRREEFQQKTYPRSSTQEPNRLPRRGRRGGWMRDPARGVAKLDGSNSAQRAWWEEQAGAVDDEFASKLQEAAQQGANPTGSRDKPAFAGGPAFQELLDQHLSELDALKVQMPSADDFRTRHIRHLTKTQKPNPVHEATEGRPPLTAAEEPEDPVFLNESLENRRQLRRGRFLGSRAREGLGKSESFGKLDTVSSRKAAWMENSDDSSDSGGEDEDDTAPKRGLRGRRSARVEKARQSRGDPSSREQAVVEEAARMVSEDQAPMEPFEPLRTTCLGDLWSLYGASWVEFNRTVVPSTFALPNSGESAGATLDAYHHTRESASLMDLSFKVGLRVTGADREFVADQFLTCNLRAMRPGDVQYACVLDSKGLILDDAFVYLTEDSVEILTSGHHSKQVADYLGQYVVHVRRSGADVSFGISPKTTTLALQGPKSREALSAALRRLRNDVQLVTPDSEQVPLAPEVLEEMPYMSFMGLRSSSSSSARGYAIVLCAGTTGEDGFEIVAQPGPMIGELAEALLAETDLVRPAGVFVLDMLRMEAGLPRVGADIPSGKITPVRASLSWMLDQSKMRSHLMFGWQKLFFQLAKGPQFRRVGLLLDGPGHAGCRLLSNPHRQPIGEIVSTAWSPELKCRVAQAFVRPEYAKSNKHVLVTVPYHLPMQKMRQRAIKHWLRSGPLRSAYRKLVAACIVPLPFVPHRYPEPIRQRKASARLRTFKGAPETQASAQTAGVFSAGLQQEQASDAPDVVEVNLTTIQESKS